MVNTYFRRFFKERLARISDRLRRAAALCQPSQPRVKCSCLGFQMRSLRPSSSQKRSYDVCGAQIDRRPTVGFGSTTPRIVCFTNRELQTINYMTSDENNSNTFKINRCTGEGSDIPPDNQTTTGNILLTFTNDSQPSIARENPFCGPNKNKRVSNDFRKRVRSAHSFHCRSSSRLQRDKMRENNANAIRTVFDTGSVGRQMSENCFFINESLYCIFAL